MDFDTLAQIWRKQDTGRIAGDEAELTQQLRSDYQREQRQLIWLNFQEGIPCLLLFVITLAVGLTIESGGWAFITAAVLFLGVGVFLVGATLGHQVSQAQFAESVRQSLERSLQQARHREWLYRNVVWCYLLPIVLGWGAIVYEKMIPNGVNTWVVVYVVVGILFFLFVGWLNRRIAVRHYRPICERIETMLQQLGEAHESNQVKTTGDES